jgi:formylglycine-generating enzyme required for sulfatase activity
MVNGAIRQAWHVAFYLLFLICMPMLVHAAPERRIALVIGNGAYESGRLNNPVNDASDMAAALRRAGFEVLLRQNVRLQEMEESLEEFGRRLRLGGVGLFYFAGHGVQTNGANYLLPVGIRIRKESDVRHEALSAERVFDEMAEANNGLNIVLLDACRDNPFTRTFRSATRGLAVLDRAPEGTFISYATGPGQVARDGEGRNSPYTAALLKQMIVPGLPIEQVFKNVRIHLSAMKQTPWELSSLKGDFFFIPGSVSPGPVQSSGRTAVPDTTVGALTGTVPPKPADDLDLILAQVQQKKDEEEKQKRKVREAEERQKEESNRRFRSLLDDLKKYEAIQSADIDAEKKNVAWGALAKKYPDWSFGIPPGSQIELLLQAIKEDKDGTWEEMAQKMGYRTNLISPVLGATFALISRGKFMMGSSSNEQGRYEDETQHEVTISRSYYMQTMEVTQGQWRKVMGMNPSHFSNCGDECPVEQVSWHDVQEFIRKLNQQEGTAKYRLPTEAEWEYSARAGTTTRFSWGNSDDCSRANYGNSTLSSECEAKNPGRTARVGSYAPNGWGLYDMLGNVWEWVQDWKGDYPSGSVTDPVGPSSGSYRVFRGGSWGYVARSCRSASRSDGNPGYRDVRLGFRLAKTQ